MKNLSIVIPVFNEEKRIHRAFEALSELHLPPVFSLKEVIFVNDGSTDKTLSSIKRFTKDHSSLPIKILTYKNNKGKGHAVKQGMLASSGEYTLLIDADMSTSFSELSKFTRFVKNSEDVIIGTRKNGKSTVTIHQPKLRELMGKTFTLITRLSLQVNVTDFTCGFKLFSQKAILTLFPTAEIKRWGYDAELLYLAKNNQFVIRECPVKWADVKDSHVKLTDAVFGTVIEIAKILYIHKIRPPFTLIQTRFVFVKGDK